jgi:hypothetical protein
LTNRDRHGAGDSRADQIDTVNPQRFALVAGEQPVASEPGAAALYDFDVELVAGEAGVDAIHRSIGFRRFEASA